MGGRLGSSGMKIRDLNNNEMYVLWRIRPNPAVMWAGDDKSILLESIKSLGVMEGFVKAHNDRTFCFTVQDERIEMDFSVEIVELNSDLLCVKNG